MKFNGFHTSEDKQDRCQSDVGLRQVTKMQFLCRRCVQSLFLRVEENFFTDAPLKIDPSRDLRRLDQFQVKQVLQKVN